MSFDEKRSRIRRVAEIAAESPLGTPPPRPTGPRAEAPDPDWRDSADGPQLAGDPAIAAERQLRSERIRHIVGMAGPLPVSDRSSTIWGFVDRVTKPYEGRPGLWPRPLLHCDRGHVHRAVWDRDPEAFAKLAAEGFVTEPKHYRDHHLVVALLGRREQVPRKYLRWLLELGHPPTPGTRDPVHPVCEVIRRLDEESLSAMLRYATPEMLDTVHDDGQRYDIPLLAALRAPNAGQWVCRLLKAGAHWQFTWEGTVVSPLHEELGVMSAPEFAGVLPLLHDLNMRSYTGQTLLEATDGRRDLQDLLHTHSRKLRGKR